MPGFDPRLVEFLTEHYGTDGQVRPDELSAFLESIGEPVALTIARLKDANLLAPQSLITQKWRHDTSPHRFIIARAIAGLYLGAADSQEAEKAPETAEESPPEPAPEEFDAYRAHVIAGQTQEKTGKLLAEKYRSEFPQWKVSRLVNRVRAWLAAGNKLPQVEGPPPVAGRPATMDPAKLEMGPRADHRPPHQRQRQSEIERDGWSG